MAHRRGRREEAVVRELSGFERDVLYVVVAALAGETIAVIYPDEAYADRVQKEAARRLKTYVESTS
jgi:hypothetical protein